MSGRVSTAIVNRFKQAKILVIGDLMLDEFVWGKVERISPEAPVPVVWVQSESHMPGGAANVARNIRALGGAVLLAGVVGKDRTGGILCEDLVANGIATDLVVSSERPTTVKTRVVAHHQQVVRVDRETHGPLPAKISDELIERICAVLPKVDAVIIEDYGKGVITAELLEKVIPAARRHKKIITVDPKEDHIELYRRVTALTPNRKEAAGAVGFDLPDNQAVRKAGRTLIKRLDCEAVLVTLGEDGMGIFEKDGQETFIPTIAQEVYDVAGAGDTVIAAFTVALAAGASFAEAARLSNYAAGIVVEKLGVATASPEELRQRIAAGPGRTG
jgi:D-beta-D-heptose 7-phosphate kinase/D-beta-D-heptose 1-phosphate adenosyltransferase